jgi:hypothetical protein
VQPFGVAGKAVVPMAVQMHGQDRGVMRPMFKQRAVGFQQGFQGGGFVALATAEQDHVVRARHSVDAVDLHETDAVNESGEGRAAGWPRGRLGQSVAVQEQAAGGGVCQKRQHVAGVAGPVKRSTATFIAASAACRNIVTYWRGHCDQIG